jgi:hypothetical protein
VAISIGGAVKNSGTGVGPWSVNIPSGIQDGDYWLIILSKDDDPSVGAPTGFSTAYQKNNTTYDDLTMAAFYKYYATAPVSAVDITGGDNESWIAMSYWVRGADTTEANFVSGAAGTETANNNSNSPTASAPSSGGATGDLTLSHFCSRSNTTPSGWTAPTGMVELTADQEGTGTGDAQIGVYQEAWVDNSSHQLTNALGGRDWISLTFVLAAASGITEETGTPTTALTFDDGAPAVKTTSGVTPTSAMIFDDGAPVGIGGELGLITSGLIFDDGVPAGQPDTPVSLVSAMIFDDGVPVSVSAVLESLTSAMQFDESGTVTTYEIWGGSGIDFADSTPDGVSAVLEALTSGLIFDDGVPVGDTITEATGTPTTALYFADDTLVAVVSVLESVVTALYFADDTIQVGVATGITSGLIFDDGTPVGQTSGITEETGTPTTAMIFDDGVPVGVAPFHATATPADGLVFDESGTVTTYELWSGSGVVFGSVVVPDTGQTDAETYPSSGIYFDEDMKTGTETEFDDEDMIFDDGVPEGVKGLPGAVTSAIDFADSEPVGISGYPGVAVSAMDFGASVEVTTGLQGIVAGGMQFGATPVATVTDLADIISGILFSDSAEGSTGNIVSVSSALSFGAVASLIDELRRRYSFATIGEETRTSITVLHGDNRYEIATVSDDTRTQTAEIE